ncbi:MAG: prepilin peptidase [Bacteriovoracaceae bacterium]|nr:prepilin peptidase [Bacteriovoracaceae bacterium]
MMELLLVAYGDIRFKKIPNYWSIINIGIFILLTVLFPEYYRWELKTFLFPVVFFLVGFALFVLKIMGGGDAKYLVTFYLLTPVLLHESAFIFLMLSTIIVGLFLLIMNTLNNFEKIIHALRIMDIATIKQIFDTKFSYAPVILISWMWFGFENWENIFW